MTLQMTGIRTAGVCIHCFFFHFQAFGIFFCAVQMFLSYRYPYNLFL